MTNHTLSISVVIPNLNGMKFLPECLSSLREQTFGDFEIIVVDNGSTDGSAEFITREFPQVKIIALKENRGFAGGCNIGIGASSGKYIALLNNDTEVEPQWLEALHEAAEKDARIGMVASKILLDRATREIDSVGMLLYPDGIGRQRGRGEIDRGQYDREEEVLFPSGCAALYRREMLAEIGLFDEDFFAYCEDTDLGLRGRRAGWRAVLAPKAVVYHKYSGSAGKYSALKARLVERNRVWVAVKNFPLPLLLAVPWHTLMRYLFQVYGILAARGSAARFKKEHSAKDAAGAVVKAYTEALKGLPAMLKKRQGIKRTLSAAEFSRLLKRYRIPLAELTLTD